MFDPSSHKPQYGEVLVIFPVISACSSLQILHSQAWGKGLLELVGLLRVCDTQRVQIPTASDFELRYTSRLLDLDRLGVLPTSRQQEVLDFVNLLRHFGAEFLERQSED
eukprot:EC119323.1.p1 GENE.EC119323.1~~EC119323.1.p1  ORF type:complete len:109 (-),score=14.44 EC119323.1:23-349(-)